MQPTTVSSLTESVERMIAAAPSALDARIGATLDHDFHAEACAVLEISPDPQNSFEIAVVLSTLGYTDTEAATLGCHDLFDMAERIYEIVEIYFRTPIDDTPPELLRERMRRNMRYLLRGFSYVELWVLSLLLLWVNRASFWSGGTLTELHATAISAALISSSILTAPVIQSYTRRYLFYSLQDNVPLARSGDQSGPLLRCRSGVRRHRGHVVRHGARPGCVDPGHEPGVPRVRPAARVAAARVRPAGRDPVGGRPVRRGPQWRRGAPGAPTRQLGRPGRRQAPLHPAGDRDRRRSSRCPGWCRCGCTGELRHRRKDCPDGLCHPARPASLSRSRPTRSTVSSSSRSCSRRSCSPAAPSG